MLRSSPSAAAKSPFAFARSFSAAGDAALPARVLRPHGLAVRVVRDLEVEPLPVRHLQEREAHLARLRARELLEVREGVEVLQALRHLRAGDEEVLVVEPRLHERLPRRGLRLRDLVLVVREDEVHAAGVEVDGLAEVTHRQSGALEVPAWPSLAEPRLPEDVAVRGVPGLPEREVLDVLLVVLVRRHAPARACLQVREVEVAELPVRRERRDLEVDRPVRRLVGGALREELLDELDHLLDRVRVRRARHDGRALDPQRVEVLQEQVEVERRELVERLLLLLRALDRLVVHVGDVHDVAHGQPLPLERPAEEVVEQERPQVSYVDAVVDRRAAGVEGDLPRGERDEVFFATREGVPEFHRAISGPRRGSRRHPRRSPRRGRSRRDPRSSWP